MTLVPPHRKQVTHFNEPGHYHELTFSCFRRLPLLTDDVCRGLLSHSIEQAMARHHYRLVAFVYMPTTEDTEPDTALPYIHGVPAG